MIINFTCRSAKAWLKVGKTIDAHQEHITLEVAVENWRSSVLLETGENLRDLDGNILVRRLFPDDDDDDDEAVDPVGAITYIPEWEDRDTGGTEPACYQIDLFVPEDLFLKVYQATRAGVLPEVGIDLPWSLMREDQQKAPYAGFEYGYFPDGSDKKWHNKQHNMVGLFGYHFGFTHIDEALDDDDEDDLVRSTSSLPPRSSIDVMRTSVNAIVEQVRQIRTYVSYLLTMAAVVFAYFVIDKFFSG